MYIQKNWKLWISCIIVAILGEASLFQAQNGVAYSLFIAGFYIVFFYLFRKTEYNHKQVSILLFLSIWILAGMFVVYSNHVLNVINAWFIPFLLLAHTVLLTNSTTVQWHKLSFLSLLANKVGQTFRGLKILAALEKRRSERKIEPSSFQKGKKIGVGILISIPLLVVITSLLSMADEKFARLLFTVPDQLFTFQLHSVWRMIVIVFLTFFFFFYFIVLNKRARLEESRESIERQKWDPIILTTVLLFINLVYFTFTVVQFQYFFSETVAEGFSYAQYARRGFFELLVVTVINFILLLSTLTFVKNVHSTLIKILLTLLIAFTGVLLVSAFLRLMLYEHAYGYTYLRVFAHAFMIYLFIIFAFTLIKVWVHQLVLARFYLMITLVFYVGVNVVGIDHFIVTKNLERYETTRDIDLEYLNQLSYSAIPSMVKFYQQNPDFTELKEMLLEKKKHLAEEEGNWHSFNLSYEKAKKMLDQVK